MTHTFEGGSVHWSEADQLWYMWAAEIVNSCGLDAWACNSQVVYATAATLNEKFTRGGALTFSGDGSSSSSSSSSNRTDKGDLAEVEPRFAHEPVVTRGPAGEYVMYWTGCDPGAPESSPYGALQPVCSSSSSSTDRDSRPLLGCCSTASKDGALLSLASILSWKSCVLCCTSTASYLY